MRVLVVDGKYYEIPEYITNSQVALDYIDTIKKITDDEVREVVEGPPPTTTPTPGATTKGAGAEGENDG